MWWLWVTLNRLKQVLEDVQDIGGIADFMTDWKGKTADALNLSYPERKEIIEAHRSDLGEQK